MYLILRLGWDDGYLIGLFIFRLQPEIEKRVEMFKPKSFSDAYHLARFQETKINLMKNMTSPTLFHNKDSREVMDKNFGLMGMDKVCNKLGYQK